MPRVALSRRRSSLALSAVVLLAWACEVPGVTPVEVEEVVASAGAKSTGDGQTARVLNAVATAPTVIISDQKGRGMRGVTVTFTASNGGSVGTSSVSTDDNGAASPGSWTLGCGAGSQTLTASPAGLPQVVFNATATVGVPSGITKTTTTDNQSATVATAVANAPSVTVRDASSVALGCITVNFVAGSGSGSVTSGTATTNAAGVATVGAWTLGNIAGSQSLTANVTGTLITATFAATGTAGAAASVAANSSATPTATTGSAVSPSPSVIVKDQFGNNVSGNVVTWSIPSGPGTLGTPVAVTTGSAGVATSPTWTMSSSTGAHLLRATATGTLTGNPVNFTATASSPNTLAINAGNNQTAGTSQSVATQPSVLVRNSASAPLAGVTVTFTIASGGGAVSGSGTPTGTTFNATTNSSGLAFANWQLGGSAGTNTLTASCSSCTPSSVTFTATAVAGNTLSIGNGSGITGTVGSTHVNQMVSVKNSSGAALAGVTINWAPASGSGSVAPTSNATNVAGAAATDWTLGTTAGSQTMTATVVGITTIPQSVTFTATATAGPAAVMVKTGGDNQSANVSTAVPLSPTVRVDDTFGNPVSNVNVTFAVASGGGTVNGGVVSTSPAGTASPTGAWTLGPTPGTNTLSATAGGLSQTFTATGVSSVDPCTVITTFTTSSNIPGALSSADCNVANKFLDKYRLTVASQTAVTITYSSGAYQPMIDYKAPFLFTNNNASGATNQFYLAPGTYDFEATTNSTNATGSYTLVSTPSVAATGCPVIDMTRNVNITDRILSTADCSYTITSSIGSPSPGARFAEGFTIRLVAGQQVVFDMPACAFDSYMELRDGILSTGTSITADDDTGVGTCSQITFTPSVTGFYTLWITSFATPTSGGTYTLTVSP